MKILKRSCALTPASSCLLLALSTSPGIVAAQSPGNLEEIVVTATRIEQSLNSVAAAISVVEQDDIQLARQQLALDESLSRVPGVFMQNRYNFAQDLRVAIRGFGARAAFGIRGIKIVVDGIPETLPDGQGSVDAIDLGSTGRIEVLRGPSSSMYGNASGGVIAVTTQDPPADPETQIRVSAGDYGFRKLQAKFGGSTSDGNVGYLVSIAESELDGYREHSKAENTQLSARLNFNLSNDRELITIFNYTDQPTSDDPGGINAAQAAADPRSARDANLTFDGGEALEQIKLGAVYSHPFGNGHAINARGYYLTRDFSSLLPFQAGGLVEFDREFIGGGLSYSHSGSIGGRSNELIIGVEFDSQDDDRLRFNNDNGVQGLLTFDQNEQVESRGVFIQDVYSLSDTVDLSFGVRFDDVEYDVRDRFLTDGSNDSGTLKFSDTSPMLGISVALTDTLHAYANYSTSFETPTTTELANPDASGGFNQDLDSQTAENLEVGLRGSIGGRNFFDVAIFDTDVKDELVPWESQLGREYFRNASSSNRTGIEFSVVSELTSRLRTTVAYTVSDFEFDEYVTFDGDVYSGNEIPGIADSYLFAELTYTHPNGWFASVDASVVGDQYANDANSVDVGDYTVANLRIGGRFESGAARFAPFVGINNLTDETYFSNIRINAFGGRFFEPAPDRNVYAGVTIDF